MSEIDQIIDKVIGEMTSDFKSDLSIAENLSYIMAGMFRVKYLTLPVDDNIVIPDGSLDLGIGYTFNHNGLNLRGKTSYNHTTNCVETRFIGQYMIFNLSASKVMGDSSLYSMLISNGLKIQTKFRHFMPRMTKTEYRKFIRHTMKHCRYKKTGSQIKIYLSDFFLLYQNQLVVATL